MENFKAGDKVAIMTKDGGFVFSNNKSMDFDLKTHPGKYAGWLWLSDYGEAINAIDGHDPHFDFIAIHLKDVAQINALPPEQRFEAAKKLYQS